FASRAKGLVEGAQLGLVSDRRQGCHVECGTNLAATAPDVATTMQQAAITGQWSDADELGDRLAVELAQFGQLGSQGGLQHRANALERTQRVEFSLRSDLLLDLCVETT